jgi:hypothetical protein
VLILIEPTAEEEEEEEEEEEIQRRAEHMFSTTPLPAMRLRAMEPEASSRKMVRLPARCHGTL